MTRRLLILCGLFTLFTINCYSQNVSNDEKLRSIVKTDRQAEVWIPYPGINSVDILTRNVSILSVKNKEVHISLSPLTVEWFISQRYDYQIVNRDASKGIATALNVNQAMEWDKYPTYSQYDSIMQSFKNLYPSLCHLDTIGTSVNGMLVLALKISDNAGTNENEPEVFYSSTIHGDETGGFILMLRLADYLLKNYNLNSRVKTLVDNLEIWINPLANPDGTYRTGNTMSSPIRSNANGYDLNRNFPDPFTPNTIKQKETLDMMSFMRKHRFVLSANFHSGNEVVNYPWDRWLSKIHADDSWFYNISRAYADTVHFYAGAAYMNGFDNGITRGALWYIITGGRQDYITYELQGREVTIEIDDQYITPAAQLSLLWQNNYHSLIGYLENALYGIHGVVRNATTLAPLKAKIFISGHDKDSSHVYSDTLTGSFVRYLEPGLWNLTFSLYGYHELTLNNVVVSAGQSTSLVVDMNEIISGVDTTDPEIPLLYPNPARTELKAVIPQVITGKVNIRIINTAGTLVSDYSVTVVEKAPVLLDVRNLNPGYYTVIFENRAKGHSYRVRLIVSR